MKTIEFFQTTKGYIAKVNGIITWFVRDEREEPQIKPNENWLVYKSEDNGKSFKLIPADPIRDENSNVIGANVWGWSCLQSAKAFIYRKEIIA